MSDETQPRTLSFQDPPRPLFAEPVPSDPHAGGVPDLPQPVFDDPAPGRERAERAETVAEPSVDEMRRRAAAAMEGYRPLLPRRKTLAERLPFGLGLWLPGRGKVAIALVVLGAIWVAQSWDRQVTPREEEHGLVLRAGDVAAKLTDFPVRPEHETFEKWKRIDGPVRYRYEYAPPGDSAPHLAVTTRIERTEEAARDAFRWTQVNLVFDWQEFGEGSVGLVELDEACAWGDESRAYLVEVNGVPAGNSFAARSGRRCIYVTLRNRVIEDGEELREVLDPTLRRLAAFRP